MVVVGLRLVNMVTWCLGDGVEDDVYLEIPKSTTESTSRTQSCYCNKLCSARQERCLAALRDLWTLLSTSLFLYS
jgi:hypothetical protein